MQTSDVYLLTEGLRDLFRQPSLYHLLKGKLGHTHSESVVNCVHASLHTGMYGFLHEKHKETFEVFYNELTGKTLEKATPLPPIKRVLPKATPNKHLPPAKRKFLEPNSDGKTAQGQLSTGLLTKAQHLDASTHMNHDH